MSENFIDKFLDNLNVITTAIKYAICVAIEDLFVHDFYYTIYSDGSMKIILKLSENAKSWEKELFKSRAQYVENQFVILEGAKDPDPKYIELNDVIKKTKIVDLISNKTITIMAIDIFGNPLFLTNEETKRVIDNINKMFED